MQNKCTFAGIICEKNNKKGYLVTQFVTCKPFHRSNWVRRRPRLLGYLRISKKSSTFAAELYKNNTQQFVNLLLYLLE